MISDDLVRAVQSGGHEPSIIIKDLRPDQKFSEALLSASQFLHSCPNVYTRHRIAPINVHTPTYMRAPGEASGVFALEAAMDELTVALNIDPVELRLRNEPEEDEFKDLPFSSRSTENATGWLRSASAGAGAAPNRAPCGTAGC